jgi:hypothetical protein
MFYCEYMYLIRQETFLFLDVEKKLIQIRYILVYNAICKFSLY